MKETNTRDPSAQAWDPLTLAGIIRIDERLAVNEDPTREGLQALQRWQAAMIVDWLSEHVEPASRVSRYATSADMARIVGRSIGRKLNAQVTNLQAKSALALCGFEPATPHVQIAYFRISLVGVKKGGKR